MREKTSDSAASIGSGEDILRVLCAEGIVPVVSFKMYSSDNNNSPNMYCSTHYFFSSSSAGGGGKGLVK